MRVLICEEEGDTILIDVQSLVDWSILPPNFPEPQDPKEKVILTKQACYKYGQHIGLWVHYSYSI